MSSQFDFRMGHEEGKSRKKQRLSSLDAMGRAYLVSELGRVHGRIAIRFAKHGIATRVLPSVRNLISGERGEDDRISKRASKQVWDDVQ